MSVLRFIARFIDARGFSPSVEEIKHAMGLKSKATVVMYLGALSWKGLVEWEPRKPRTLHLTDQGKDSLVVRVG